MNFVKYHVCYCDYIVSGDAGAEQAARSLCDRHSGAGASGLVAVRENPFRARFFRPDGREMPLDLSGILCAGAYLCERCGSPKISVLASVGVIDVELGRGDMRVFFPVAGGAAPRLRRADVTLPTEYVKCRFAGAERAVCPTDDIYSAMLFGIGEKMSVYRAFPSGADVDFVRVISKNKLEVRSYERGAGYVTSASGAAAAASVLLALGRCDANADIAVDCGKMSVHLSDRPCLSASVTRVMTGKT